MRPNNPQKQRNSGSASTPGPIPSPYTFIPLSENVFFPAWADKVSMDVPFRDGISGTITLKVTATAPIYIRNGGAHPEGEERHNDESYLSFFRVYPGGPFAIPGTSLKGMLRNVVEIASFAKIIGGKKAPRVDNHRYAVRDLSNEELYKKHLKDIKTGWLFVDSQGDWLVSPCDYVRVEQEDIEKSSPGAPYIGGKGSCEQKYRLIAPYTKIRFDSVKEPYGPLATNIGPGKTEGILVLTGQPSSRSDGYGSARIPNRKHLEFIFYNEQSTTITVTPEVKDDFEFAHANLGEKRKPNAEWAFWKKRLDKGERVPVFMLTDGKGISSMGLAMMFRLPYKNTVHDTIDHTSADHSNAARPDLAELIFGRVEDQSALRGRVNIETLIVNGAPNPMGKVTTVLGSPKPTYYPNYLKQDGNQNTQGSKQNNKAAYKTFMDDDAEICGWKRYIARSDSSSLPKALPTPFKNANKNLNVATSFRPLPAGTSFTGTIHIHNLREVELGALIWAITWGGRTECRHLLGMAKSYGFGSVTIKIENSSLKRNYAAFDAEHCMAKYVDLMKAKVEDWEETDQVSYLLAAASPDTTWQHDLTFPSLGSNTKTNEFVGHKKAGHALLIAPKLDSTQNEEPENRHRDKLPPTNKVVT